MHCTCYYVIYIYKFMMTTMITADSLSRVLQGSNISTFGTARVLHHPPQSDSLPPTRESILSKLKPATAVQACQEVQTSSGRPMMIGTNIPPHCSNPIGGITEYVQINTSSERTNSLIDARAWRQTQTMLPKTNKSSTGRALPVDDSRMNRNYETDVVGMSGRGPVVLPNGIQLDLLAGRNPSRARLPMDLQPAPSSDFMQYAAFESAR